MTHLHKIVKRTVTTKWRPLVVILHPDPPSIEVREKRKRSGYVITLAALFQILAERSAAMAVAEKRKRRKLRGSAL